MTTPWQPGFQGVTVVPPTYTDPHNYSPVSELQLVASTGLGGFALQNATPTLIQWTAPNDNQMHTVFVVAAQHVTGIETGGAVGVFYTLPDGTTNGPSFFAGGSGTGPSQANPGFLVQPGSTFFVKQNSPLTAGAATVWASIWAS